MIPYSTHHTTNTSHPGEGDGVLNKSVMPSRIASKIPRILTINSVCIVMGMAMYKSQN